MGLVSGEKRPGLTCRKADSQPALSFAMKRRLITMRMLIRRRINAEDDDKDDGCRTMNDG